MGRSERSERDSLPPNGGAPPPRKPATGGPAPPGKSGVHSAASCDRATRTAPIAATSTVAAPDGARWVPGERRPSPVHQGRAQLLPKPVRPPELSPQPPPHHPTPRNPREPTTTVNPAQVLWLLFGGGF